MNKNKKAQVAIYITAIMFALVLISLVAVLAPMGVRFNSEMFLAGQSILNSSLPSINNITNTEIRTVLNGTINSAILATEDNISINANIFQYGWILVIGLTMLVLFLFTRRIVEFGGGGLV